MKYFSYEGGCGILECTCIEALKEELGWTIDEWLQVISHKMLFKMVILLRK